MSPVGRTIASPISSKIYAMTCLASLLLGLAATAAAQDVYFEVPLEKLEFKGEKLPDGWDKYRDNIDWSMGWTLVWMMPRVVVEGEGEAFLQVSPDEWQWSLPKVVGITARAKRGQEVRGTLYLPKTDWSGMLRLPFRIPAEAAGAAAERAYFEAKAQHYNRLLQRNVAGAAWFRWQYEQAMRALGKPADAPQDPPGALGGVDETFELFSGGRAISENLQLDRRLLTPRDDREELSVPLDSLPGITVAEIDWKNLLQAGEVPLDPLAAHIPHDQHAVFFPTFAGMLQLMDEAEKLGAPLIVLWEPRTEDARTKDRYQTQLCLETSALSRVLGPHVISSVAVTGSDPYLRTGADVAVLFAAKQKEVLMAFVRARQSAAMAGARGAKPVRGEVRGTSYEGVVSPDRTVSSYLAALGETVVVTNSLAQLGRIVEVSKGAGPALASLEEYKVFRQRYPLGGKQTGAEGDRLRPSAGAESAFFLISDATIRRWCSARWRIGNSRRLRAGAILSQIAAEYQDDQVKGNFRTETVDFPWKIPHLGKITLTHAGPRSEAYGSLEFMTPIVELPMDKVTPHEADAYRRWLEQYQQQWRFFDPIGGTMTLQNDSLTADISVLPMILGSEYMEFARIADAAEIAPQTGDPHADVLAHLLLATDRQSEMLKQLEDFVRGFITNGDLEIKGKKVSPLAWWGKSVAIYADASPFWTDMANSKSIEEYLLKNKFQVPVVLRIESTDQTACQLFFEKLISFLRAEPGIKKVDKMMHQNQAYIGAQYERLGNLDETLFCAATPDALLLTHSEETLKRAIDRRLTPVAPPESARAWLGKHLAGRITSAGMAAWHSIMAQSAVSELRAKSWSNLPILNEWKRRYPDEDALALHEKLWHARLVCPGGGQYVWNEKWQTMESTVFGHPGEPKAPPAHALKLLPGADGLDFGISFERVKGTLAPGFPRPPGTEQPDAPREADVLGLRAKLRIERN